MEINFKNVNYKDLKNLNITFKENEITSIIGKNSSGKSSILNLIYGLFFIESGELKIGKNLIKKGVRCKTLTKIRNDISYLQEFYIGQLFHINVFDDIKYNLDNVDTEKLDELLNLFFLDKSILDKNYNELSNGEKKKILLIKLFMENKKIILLDNPNSGLDYKSVQSLIKILRKEKRHDKIIIIISEDSNFLLQVCDNVVAIDNGKILIQDEKNQVFTKRKLLDRCYLVAPKVLDFEMSVKDLKDVKLGYRDNVNDLLKDIYRNAK